MPQIGECQSALLENACHAHVLLGCTTLQALQLGGGVEANPGLIG